VFSRALAESPDDRFETSMAFADALQQALGKRTRSAVGRLASRPLPLEGDADPEPARFAPLPADELPQLTDAMLASAASDIIEPVVPIEPVVSIEPVVAEANDGGVGVAVAESLLVPTGADGAEEAEWSVAMGALPADDLPLAPPEPRMPERNDTTRPVSAAPHEQTTSIVIPRAAAEPPAVEPAARVGDEDGHQLSGVRPLVLALVVGVAIGVPIGVFIAPERLTSRAAERAALPAAAPAAMAGDPIREFTDRAAVRDELVAPPATPSAAPRDAIDAPRTPVADRAVPNPASTRPERTAVPQTAAARTASAKKTDIGKASKPVAKAAAAPARPRPAAPTGPSATGAVRATAPAAAGAPAAASTEPGSLLVDSRPPGANVFLDGRLIGTTPLVLSSIALGEHAIHLERAGYRRWASSVKIVSGERSRVAASLEYR
jgi:hypothetical protein